LVARLDVDVDSSSTKTSAGVNAQEALEDPGGDQLN
jgi:hypothetical protein